jgi:cytochrome c oxidase subunit II
MGIFSIFPPRVSANAGEVDALYGFLLVVAGVMTALIFLAIAYFATKYRRRSPDDRPSAIHGSIPLEVTWSVIPFLIMLVMFVWGTKLYFQNYTLPPPDALNIYVVGKQWMWKVQYPGGQREINELHIPVGRPVKLTLASEDVIHSFYIPAFRMKHDVVPGSYQFYWVEARQTGRFHIFCAEYCGTNHSKMTGWVTVMQPADYESWLASENTVSTLETHGERLFEQYGCATCHVVNAQGRSPSLRNVFGGPVTLDDGRTVTADETYLRESILDPNAKIAKGYQRGLMPVYQGQINEEELIPLIAYIKSLAVATPPEPAGRPAPAKGTLP